MLILHPDSCTTCPLSEKRAFLYHCKHYNRGSMADPDHRPEYCRVKRIVIEEEGE